MTPGTFTQALIGPRLGSSILDAFLKGLPLGRGWVRVSTALRLRFCDSVKPSQSTFGSVLTSFLYKGGAAATVYRGGRVPAISNWRGR
jgi:hypothetical protein